MIQELNCAGCGRALARLQEGEVHSFGFAVGKPEGATHEDQSVAICTVCGHQTAFNSAFLKAILGIEKRDGGPGRFDFDQD